MLPGRPASIRRRIRLTKANAIVLTLLLAAFAVTLVLSLPRPAEFVLPGEAIPVSEVGVDGSVHFMAVSSGVTRNLFERWSVLMAYRDADARPEFTNLSRSEMLAYEETYLEKETLNFAVGQAVAYVSEQTAGSAGIADSTDLTARTMELINELEDYHGDSLGLMLAVGLYEERTGIRYGDGYDMKIAGTGTLEEDGFVGPVGAVRQKLAGAQAEGVDLFFVPADYDWLGEEGNEAEARRAKRELGLTLEIVPVQTLQDAIDYLDHKEHGVP